MKTEDHLVSVVMPVLNGGDLLRISLESVRDQNYANIEMIVVDDGSTDDSDKVLESFSNSMPGRLKVLKHPGGERRGIAASYKLGLEHCPGKYVAFLEQDDIWQANKISEQIKIFEKYPDVGIVFSDVYTCDKHGNFSKKLFKTLINKPPTGKPFTAFMKLLWGNYVSTFSNVMVRTIFINKSDILTNPEGFQDWMFLLQLSKRCRFFHTNNTRVYWRQWQDSYFGELRQKSKYMSVYRKSRILALRNAIDRILNEKQMAQSRKLLPIKVSKKFWNLAISILSGAERLIDSLNRKVFQESHV